MTEVIIAIPTPLRVYVGNQKRVVVHDETTIEGALGKLTTTFPKLKQHLFEGDEIRNYVNVYLNNEDIRYLNPDEVKLQKGDTIAIIPSIAGGT
ncbi:MAG: MoaD/ThiS family protein [Candidatus Kariarchaeaceae archaeon]|jgi:molybdopterin converting factor small subunit